MKRVALVSFAVLMVAWLIIGGVLSSRARARLQAVRDERAADHARRRAEVEDALRVVSPLFVSSASGGRDVSSLIHAQRVKARDADVHTWGPGGWLAQTNDPRVDAVDLSWMASLDAYDFYDLDARLALSGLPYGYPAPFDFLELRDDISFYAQVRLLRGLRDDALLEASREVRALARVFVASESMLGLGIAQKLWEFERHAWQQAPATGKRIDGVTPIDEPMGERIWLVATSLPRSIFEDATTERGPFHCMALRDGLFEAHRYELLLRPALRVRYEALERELEESPCRLPLARANILAPDRREQLQVSLRSMFARTRTGEHLPDVPLGWLPLARLPLGVSASIGWED